MSGHGPNCECRGCEHAELEQLRAELAQSLKIQRECGDHQACAEYDLEVLRAELAAAPDCDTCPNYQAIAERDEARAVAKDLHSQLCLVQAAYDDAIGREPHINGVALVAEKENPWLEESSDE